MLLTGFAGLISLGTAGLLGAGAYSVGMLVREVGRAILGDAAGRGCARRASSA